MNLTTILLMVMGINFRKWDMDYLGVEGRRKVELPLFNEPTEILCYSANQTF